MKKMSFYKTRKFRYGALATVLTAVFVAVVILLNVVFTALCEHYLWYADMTGSEVFTLGESTKEYLSDIDDELFIYFCNDEDKVKADSALLYVYNTARLLAEENSRITVECHNVRVEKAFFEPFLASAAGGIDTTSVVLYDATSGESRVYGYRTFFVFDDDETTVWAYNGEYKFLSAILQVTSSEQPIVYFTLGHGEDVTKDFTVTADADGNYVYPGAYALATLFADAGFSVRTINLSEEDPDPDARILVIYNPVYDFIGAAEAEDDRYNEIRKLSDFLTVGDNALMVFGDTENSGPFAVSESGAPVSNLAEFLDEWGLAFRSGTAVRDYSHARSVDGLTIQPQYTDDTMGSSLYSSLLSLSSMPMTAIRNAMAIEMTRGASFDKNAYDRCEVSPILTSYDTAELLRSGTAVESGQFTVAALARARRLIDGTHGNNGDYFANYRYSYVLAFGSPSFSSSSYLYSNVYANRDILFAAMKAVGRDTVLASINFKTLDDDTINVTTAQANGWTAAMTCVLPALAAVCGIVVCVRRKHS